MCSLSDFIFYLCLFRNIIVIDTIHLSRANYSIWFCYLFCVFSRKQMALKVIDSCKCNTFWIWWEVQIIFTEFWIRYACWFWVWSKWNMGFRLWMNIWSPWATLTVNGHAHPPDNIQTQWNQNCWPWMETWYGFLCFTCCPWCYFQFTSNYSLGFLASKEGHYI